MASLPQNIVLALTRIKGENESIQSMRLSNKQLPRRPQYELEVRYKSYREATEAYKQGVTFRDYERVSNMLENQDIQPKIINSTDSIRNESNNTKIRYTQHDSEGNIAQQDEWIRKTRIYQEDDNIYRLRYVISKEERIEPIPNFQAEVTRRKERKTYVFQTHFQVDLTKVTMFNEDEIMEITYEVEVEAIDWETNWSKTIDNFPTILNDILKAVHGTNNVYTVKEYIDIVRFVNIRLNTRSRDLYQFNHRVLFQARNLHRRDLVYGGLVGNTKYTYSVTVKADGIRKLLVIHSSGVWLVMGPDEADLVIRSTPGIENNYQELVGSILEGEIVPYEKISKSKRLYHNGAPITPYWFLIYDCLSIAETNQIESSYSIQNEHHNIRISEAQHIAGRFRESNIITVWTKDFHGFTTAYELFDIIRRLESLRETRTYKDDGYIFTAEEMPYNLVDNYTDWQDRTFKFYPSEDRSQAYGLDPKSAIRDIGTIQNQTTNWTNGSGRTLLIETDSQIRDLPGNFSDNDSYWFADHSAIWIKQDNKWVLTKPRKWNSVPRICRRKGGFARILQERSGEMYYRDGILYQTIKTLEKGKAPIRHIPLRLRKLTRYPDICKWKPTYSMDFSIKWRALPDGNRFINLRMGGPMSWVERQTRRGVVCKTKDELIPFKGTSAIPFEGYEYEDTDITVYPVDHNNEMTKDLPTGTIVEYEWDMEQEIMRPVVVRHDKSKPNRAQFALDNWTQSQRPIDLLTLRGQSFDLMRSYHNKIKFDIYNTAYKKLGKNVSLLDIGSGRGGDVHKWSDITRGVLVEPNSEHISELISRISNTLKQQIVEVIFNSSDIDNKVNLAKSRGDRMIVVQTGGEDNILITQVVNSWLGGKADILSLMLSMSFFWKSEDMIKRLAQTVRDNLHPQGMGIFFTIDGELVRQAFSPTRISNNQLMGGQKYEHNFIKLGEGNGAVTLQYSERESKLNINIPGTIVENQEEWLVYLSDLEALISDFGFKIDNLQRADQERFMNQAELRLSKMYTSGLIVPIISEKENIETTLVRNIHGLHVTEKISSINKSQLRLRPSSPPSLQASNAVGSGTTYQASNAVGSGTTYQASNVPQISIPKNTTSPRAAQISTVISPVVSSDQQTPTFIRPAASSVSLNPEVLPEVRYVNHLPMLSVYMDSTQDRAIGDDVSQILNVTWYKEKPVVRIACIPDGSCFFHAVVKAIFAPYAETSSLRARVDFIKMLRRDLAAILRLEDPETPGKTLYETAANGMWVEYAELQKMGLSQGEELDLGFDPTLDGIINLLNSSRYVGNELYKFVGDFLGINIYVVVATINDLRPIMNTSEAQRTEYPSIVIAGNGAHYELVGVDMGPDNGIQTVFFDNDSFIQALRGLSEDEGGAISP